MSSFILDHIGIILVGMVVYGLLSFACGMWLVVRAWDEECDECESNDDDGEEDEW